MARRALLSFDAMKRIAIAALLLAIACKQETVVTDTTPMDTREPVAIRYVG